ncbi:MAG: TlyA family RNA methyltransferase [Burkholderiaceae bacterium]|jgi:23S rRNA (cytidine1920-2'-O)/16S rRNA (cytidine1409-2'-O)-methyltransferase|nr:TlyA family RNA methyltransferase [Burkholderiaceae bacterium]
MRADVFLVETGHAATRSQAQRLIAGGVQWRMTPLTPWKKVAKNGDEIPAGAELQLLDGAEAKYISRGGLKLEGALAATGLSVAGLRCLDVGQSTGGFTDCLLQAGAAQVIGVDVGHGQLHERLRADVRVVCVEGLNARSVTAESLQEACEEVLSERWEEDPDDNDTQPVAPYAWMRNGGVVDDDYDDSEDARESDIEAFKAERAAKGRAREEGTVATQRRRRAEFADVDITPRFDFVTGDVSFISLTLVLPAVTRLLKPQGQLLMLVKPQFELQPGQVGKGGIVRDAALFAEVEQRLRACLSELGLKVLGWMDSAIEGGDGNREFFVHARQGDVVQELPQPEAQGEDEPRPAVKAAAKRVSRTVLREQRNERVIDTSTEFGVPGPGRAKLRKRNE